MRIASTLIRRRTGLSTRSIEAGLRRICTITESPEGPVVQGRFPRPYR